MAAASKTTITELRRTGAGVVEATPIRFEWDGATHTGIQGDLEHELMVKTVRTEPPGTEEPVEQVLAATWQPFQVSGEWRDSRAGRGFAWQTYLDFSKLVGRGSLVRLQLDRLSFVGLITNFRPAYRTVDQIRYSFTMSPHLNEAVGGFRPLLRGILRVAKPIAQRVEEVTALSERLDALAATAGQLTVAANDISDVTAGLDEMHQAVGRVQAISIVEASANAERKLLELSSAFTRVRSAGITIAQSVADKRADLTLATDNIIETLRFSEWMGNTFYEGMLAAGLGREAADEMRARAARRPRAIHRCQEGESLERIALRYYGTADGWRLIYDANHLQSYVLESGQELLIPERVA